MARKRSGNPPKWAQQFLRFYCRRELLEDLEGDLNEFFERNVQSKGLRSARWIYVVDVLKFLRLYTLRKPEFMNLLTKNIMIGSYIKTSGRSIIRSKLFSGINIVGLAISMSVGLLMIAFLSDLLAYDDFHEKKERIYRLITKDQSHHGSSMNLASTSVRAGRQIQQTIPGIEELTIMRRGFSGDAKVGESTLSLEGLWADNSFFKVFTFPLVEGNPNTALKEPYSLVLTQKTAKRLFGAAAAIGRTIKFDTLTYTVTGIMRDIPKLSHMRFEALVSFSTVELQAPATDGDFMSWENIYSTYVYLMLPPKARLEKVQAGLNKLSTVENAAIKNREITISLQPLKKISIGKHLTNPIGPTMNIVALSILSGLAFVVIVSACFNYTNLSIARSLRRSREVGIRKVIGALKTHVFGQFITESVIISLSALVFAFLLFLLLRTQFLSFDPFLENLVSLDVSTPLIFYFILMAIGVGIMAGLLPALFYARIRVTTVLKDVSLVKIFRHVNMRKALIVIQYSFSLIFITATIIGYGQYKGFLSLDLGFTTDNILNIRMQGNNDELLIKELSEMPAVTGFSRSRIVSAIGTIYGTQMKYNDQQDSSGVWLNFVDERYLPLHNYQFITGNNFSSRPKNAEEFEVIVNQQVLERFKIGNGNPNKALGEILNIDGKKLAIVGILKDFHYGTVENKIEPMVFRYSTAEPGGFINVRIATTDWQGTLATISTAWKKIDRVHPLDAKFYNDQIAESYNQFSVMLKVIGFLSFLAICISSMGLFGMVVYITETRLKEISIRKVLGASEQTLVYLLSKGFLLLLTISALIALPLTWIFFEKVVLANFAYHQPIYLHELLIGVIIVMGIAFMMIGTQTLKVARTNPAKVLKRE